MEKGQDDKETGASERGKIGPKQDTKGSSVVESSVNWTEMPFLVACWSPFGYPKD
jgi:hypothetical protein